MAWKRGRVVAGYGVASGQCRDTPYPGGTIRLQQPFFRARGVDLSGYYAGTLNVDLFPCKPKPQCPLFDAVIRWFDDIEERFLLSPVEILANGRRYSGLWYYPHPQTKPCHHQSDSVVELLLPWIAGVAVGDKVSVKL